MKIDDWFKPLLLFFIVIFLFIFYCHSQNGRYVVIQSDIAIVTLDSRTGIVYAASISDKKAFKFDLPRRRVITSPLQTNESSPK